MKRFITLLFLCYACFSCSKNTESLSFDVYVNDVKADIDINIYIGISGTEWSHFACFQS